MSDISDMMYEQGFNDGYQKALSEQNNKKYDLSEQIMSLRDEVMGMKDREKVIKNLSIAKQILIYPQMLSREMCIRIGQAISDAIVLLKEQEAVVRCKDCKHRYDGEHVQNCCDEWMHKAGWKTEFSVDLDGFCNKGEPKDGDGDV